MNLNWPVVIFCGVGMSILLTFIIIPQILHVSYSKRLFDRLDNRKIHNGVVPRLGGMAFFPSLFLPLGVIIAFLLGDGGTSSLFWIEDIGRQLPYVVVLFASMLVLFLVGLVDDLIGLRYMAKLAAQAVSSAILVISGLMITDYHGMIGMNFVPWAAGAIITFFLILYVINAINLIDGIDGLASGISVICFVIYGILLYLQGQFLYSALAWISAGSLAVFFIFNVWGSRKRYTKIFMGDIGSLSLGLILAFLIIAIARGGDDFEGGTDPLIVALSPLVIPLFDVVRVFIVRLVDGTSPFLPDKKHIHHRMMAKGLKSWQVLIVLLVAQVGIFIANIFMADYVEINLIILVDVAIYLIMTLVARPKEAAGIQSNATK